MVSADVVLQIVVSGLLMGSIYALIGIGFTLIYGVLDVVNFAHGQLVMAAMFVTYALFAGFGVNPYLALVGVLPLFFLFGLVVYRLLIHPIVTAPHATHIIVTIGLFIFLENLANFTFGGDLRGITTSETARAFVIGTLRLPVARTVAAGASLLAMAGLALFLARTPFGMAVRASASNRLGAHLVGVDVDHVYGMTFALGTVLAAIAGTLLMTFATVSPFVGNDLMLYSFAIAIIGGLGSISGAFVAGLLIGLVEALSSLAFAASFGTVVVFGMLIAVLLFRPSGLLGRAPG
jgi:branched-chain amino acid transport system permease protein